MACYHQNLRTFWGVWLFQNFFGQKNDPTMVKIGHTFFEASFFKTKCSTKILLNINYIGLNWKTAYRINFGPREMPKLENLYFHFNALSGWGNSRGPKTFLNKVPYNYPFKFFFGAFRVKKERFKTGFPIVFLKCDLTMVRSLSCQNKSEKAKHFQNMHKFFVVECQWLKSEKCPINSATPP